MKHYFYSYLNVYLCFKNAANIVLHDLVQQCHDIPTVTFLPLEECIFYCKEINYYCLQSYELHILVISHS